MGCPRPELPNTSWFEFEILHQLEEKPRYGNELLAMLNYSLGEGSVSSGKLYPALQKLEKNGLIERTKGEIETAPTRGVDRVYFRITGEGIKEVEKAIAFTHCIFFENLMKEMKSSISIRIARIIVENLGADLKVGVVAPPDWRGMEQVISTIPGIEGISLFLLQMDLYGEFEPIKNPDTFGLDLTYLSTKFQDIPLKSDYLDSIVMMIHHSDVPDLDGCIREALRTVKPGGYFMMVESR
jgi:DNA-binding PadR family transcriptional regulator